jgi:hypothetical protein
MYGRLDHPKKPECKIVNTGYHHSLLRALLAFLLTAPIAQAGELGRLFFTPAQRTQLDRHHSLPSAPLTTPERSAEEVAKETPHSITVNGIVQRSGGKRTTWINGAAKTVSQGDESPTSAMVTLPDQNKTVRLKVGQRVILTAPPTNSAKPDAESPATTSDD